MDKFNHLKLWGKADRDEKNNFVWHPLAYHMLDVGAVAEVWLREDLKLLGLFPELAVTDTKMLIPILALSTAFHDVGKATIGFQNKIPELAKEFGLEYLPSQNTQFDHGAFCFLLLQEWMESENEFQELAKKIPFFQLWESACWHYGKTYNDSNLNSILEIENKPEGNDTVFDSIEKLRNQILSFIAESILKLSNINSWIKSRKELSCLT